MTEFPRLTVGVEHTVVFHVGEQHMVRRLLPDVEEFARKPEVMASGWLVGVCEWPAMEALRAYMADIECSLGTKVAISHVAPILAGATLSVTARCKYVKGRYSEWAVQACDSHELVAVGTVGFVVVELDGFVRDKLVPKLSELNERSHRGLVVSAGKINR
ncbi:hypothetical protein GCM10023321_50170 [Pseudonocardia eucalypti]|uniref:Fluoroacetyl-CoA-specific thioesterase-like domain-containing protein n=1 Tax=Pseudonocardia eucalypti TaxID=648755 RepID=A0ABP9QK83_9PSEU|nr:fluoroacetyl-CoA thioesterase [Pseudonocardia eucalypti]